MAKVQFKKASIKGKTLSDALFDFDEADFKDLKSVKQYVNELVKKNSESLEAILEHLKVYLKEKNL